MLDFLVDDARMPNQPQPQSREELLKYERSLKNATVYVDQLRPRIKLETDLSFSKKQSELRPEPLPENLRNQIARMVPEELGQMEFGAVLVTQKVLKSSDISRVQNHLAIRLPWLENTFLSPEEDRFLRHHNASMTVPIIEPTGKVPALNLRRLNVGINGVYYVLDGNWNDVVRENQLQEGMAVQLWAFWVNGRLNFAFGFLPREKFVAKLWRFLVFCCS